ncbi:hypothetical protein [Blastococcus goldschmidtiae]|uniref:Uncharacterized protein n=1 Tax=Blastococcus goldschmidtiae TaxID=3075546 RepID=A0ABU2KE54_9ACTN|nr:hypothetical protein [Blastococcus sp. DSM 46792]MDT0278447.1 hypothetical protein [Blastococcus sp. DSM 46792]
MREAVGAGVGGLERGDVRLVTTPEMLGALGMVPAERPVLVVPREPGTAPVGE